MQFPPDAAALLDAVGRLLDEQVMGAVPPHLQHPVRVASHLVRLVEREVALAPADDGARARAARRARSATATPDPQAALAARLRRSDDDELDRVAWAALVEITRARPGDRQAGPRLLGGRVTLDVAAGLATYLSEHWGRPVDVGELP